MQRKAPARTRVSSAGRITGLVRHAGAFGGLRDFWTKVNNDWVFNLSALLAYDVLFSVFPIVLVLLALAGYVLGNVSPATTDQLAQAIAQVLPGGVGQQVVNAALSALKQNATPVLVVGVLTAFYFGSRLFIVIENCFGIIYRLPSRSFWRQNLMAVLMLLLYVLLVPLVFATATASNALAPVLFPGGGPSADLLVRAAGIVTSLALAMVLFGAIYLFVPHQRIRFVDAWRGTILAAALLVLYQQVFPLYQSMFLRLDNYGSILGFAAVIVIFFYYVAFILLLGAEVNSWAEGQRPTQEDIPTLLYDILREHRIPTGDEPPEAQEDAPDPRAADA
jgi:membrane protein